MKRIKIQQPNYKEVSVKLGAGIYKQIFQNQLILHFTFTCIITLFFLLIYKSLASQILLRPLIVKQTRSVFVLNFIF